MAEYSRRPRALHPLGWWIWALAMATAATRTTNPLVLALIVAVVWLVVESRKTAAPWARSFTSYLVLGLVVVVARLVFYLVIGSRVGEHVIVRLPEIGLPDWAAGIRLGGPVTAEGVLAAGYEGCRIAALLICLGAANTLANSRRLLRCVPGSLYEVGTAVVVTLSVAPQLVESVQRVRLARRLRGDSPSGFAALRGIALPVLADSLDRALALAASMDARGYGRTGGTPRRSRRLGGAAVILGLVGVCIGFYGVLDGSGPAATSRVLVVAGVILAIGGVWFGGRPDRPTSYRPDPWGSAEWAVATAGVGVATGMVVLASWDPTALITPVQPLTWPSLSLWAVVAVGLGALPAVAAPPPPDSRGWAR